RFSVDYIIVPPENPCLGDPVPEVCDGIDNDCDGTVDEVDRGIPNLIWGIFSEETTFDEGDRVVAILEDGTEEVVVENQRLIWVRGLFGRYPQGQYYFEVPGNVLQLRFEEDGDGDTIGVQRLFDDAERTLPVPGDLDELADGETSERTEFGDSLGLGQTCGSDVGVCAEGRWACQDGAIECAGGVDPSAEPDVCDGFDDDCDGQVDEMIREACDTTCGRGTKACADGSECMVECDARCGVVGFRRCSGGTVYGACEYDFPVETCDGVDNDCDTDIDEGFDVDQPCFVGEGACEVEGVWGCTADGGRACSAVAGEPGTETCNGEDDDCDGMIDEAADLTAPAADEQDGVCAGAVRVCDGVNGWVEPDYGLIADYEDPETTCDGLDNDCDGTPDEAANLGAPPLADMQDGVCSGALKVCNDGWVEPDYTALVDYEATEATCNDSKDNDCDGDSDGADAADCP
ncbi:MAG: MopE-related protein, partial [Planctomycetota bacterium]